MTNYKKPKYSVDDDNEHEAPHISTDPFNELFYDNYKNLLRDRIILLNGPIKEDVVEKAVIPLIRFAEKHPRTPIQLWINSFGGSTEDGQAVVDVIQTLKTPIVTVAFGKAMRAAFDIFLAGDMRIVYPNSVLMCHSGSTSIFDQSLPSVKIESDLCNKYIGRWAKFYAERTTMTEQEWKRLLNGGLNKYFFPEEALKLGIAHRLIVPTKKKINLKKLCW